jgi:hypothetical protein
MGTFFRHDSRCNTISTPVAMPMKSNKEGAAGAKERKFTGASRRMMPGTTALCKLQLQLPAPTACAAPYKVCSVGVLLYTSAARAAYHHCVQRAMKEPLGCPLVTHVKMSKTCVVTAVHGVPVAAFFNFFHRWGVRFAEANRYSVGYIFELVPPSSTVMTAAINSPPHRHHHVGRRQSSHTDLTPRPSLMTCLPLPSAQRHIKTTFLLASNAKTQPSVTATSHPTQQQIYNTMSSNSLFKRSSGVAQEDLKLKPPLTGFFRSLAPPRGNESMLEVCAKVIADARAGLNGIDADELIAMCEMCDEHGRDVKLYQETKPGAVASRLSPSLIAVLALYTAELQAGDSPYGVCNGALRAAERSKCKPFVDFIWHVMHALAKCDAYKGGNVYRGVKADLKADYPKDREVTWFQFSSCTCDIQVEQSEQFCGSSGPRTLFSIELTTGRARVITNFSLVPSEAEVLLPPNSRFKVVSHFDAGSGLVIIQLKELPSKDQIIDFDAPSSFPDPALPAPAPAPAPALAPADGVEEELQELVSEMVKLKLGLKTSCVSFSRALALAGVMSLEELRPLPCTKARAMLEKAGMQEMQIDKVVAAYSTPPPVIFAPAPAPAPAPASAKVLATCRRRFAHLLFLHLKPHSPAGCCCCCC